MTRVGKRPPGQLRVSDRGMSQVVAVAVLIVIVILLVAVSATVLLGFPERSDPSPDVVLELEPKDGSPRAFLRHEGGDPLGGTGHTDIRGIADPDTLHEERLTAGERHKVVPIAAEIRIVWVGGQDNSYVIWRGQPASHLDISADEGCAWVASQTNNGTAPITVDGLTVTCDVTTEGDIDVVNGATIVGNATSTQNNVDLDGSTVYGPVGASGDVDLDGTNVSGSVTSSGSDIVLTDGSRVSGDVRIGAGGNVDVDGGSTVEGTIEAGGAISLDSVTVGGSVVGDASDVDISDATIDGDIRSAGSVDLSGTTVAGDVYVDPGSFSCSDSEINGQACGAYTPKDPDEY